MLLTTGFGLCNMCSKFHVDDATVERPLSETATVLQLWVGRVKLDHWARQQINYINNIHPDSMGSDIPVIEYGCVKYTKLVELFKALGIHQAGLWDNIISSQAA